jgi:hypothetical protein
VAIVEDPISATGGGRLSTEFEWRWLFEHIDVPMRMEYDMSSTIVLHVPRRMRRVVTALMVELANHAIPGGVVVKVKGDFDLGGRLSRWLGEVLA